MQAICDNQLQRIVNELIKIDRDLLVINFDNNECEVRKLIDCRRQLLANLKSIQPVNGAAKNSPVRLEYSPTKFSIERVKQWRSRVMLSKPNQHSFENSGFCNQFLDSILPETWNFKTDVMVVSAPPSSTIISKAIDRGQHHIVIFDHYKCIDEGAFSHHSIAKIVVCQTIKDVEIAFAKLQTTAEQVITVTCSLDPKFLTETKSHLAEAIRNGKKNRIANTITANRFGASWSKNLLKNLPLVAKASNIHQLSVKGVKDAVIVASGPSLNKNVHTLATIQDQVFIVAALRSIQTLHDANIKPDLVIQLDAEDDHVAREFSNKLDIEIENFLVELTVNPWFLKSSAKNFIWSYPSIFSDISQHFNVAPTPFDAPSVAIYGLTLCYLLGFESLCFVGQDLASSNTSQYANGATSLLPAHSDISTFNIEVDGFYGGKVMTRSAYHGQLLRCEHIASELNLNAPYLRLFNATEGGAYINGFEHLTLSEFAHIRDLNKTDPIKQIIWKQSTPIKPQHVADYLVRMRETMDQITKIANRIIKLDATTKRNTGEDAELTNLLSKFRSLNSKTSLLQIAMQETISSVIGTSTNIDENKSFAEFFKIILQQAEALRSIARQHECSK
ncbi:motility associated factor glycosyltransferase family protein [Alphaproteobacteria bacterium LSUCC0744]